jgi:glycosyltransferase involved in cell wall biosynthesis
LPTSDAPPAKRYDTTVSVILPCYNEEPNVVRVASRASEVMAALVRDYEIIVVNDGSRDRTGEFADELARKDPHIRPVHHATNGGYGMALRSGFKAARMEHAFYTDGDGQFDIAEITRLLDLLGTADIISGIRQHRQDNFMRRMNGKGWSWLSQRMLRFRCKDVDAAFKLYKREIFDRIELKSTGALIVAETLGRAARLGYTIRTVPVTHLPRKAGAATGAKLSVIIRAFRELVRLRKDILSG